MTTPIKFLTFKRIKNNKDGIIKGIKLQQKRIYSKEDLKIKIYECLGYFAHKHNIIINGNDLDNWFKENIK